MVLFGNIKINYYIYSNIYDQNIMSKSKKEGKPKRNSVNLAKKLKHIEKNDAIINKLKESIHH